MNRYRVPISTYANATIDVEADSPEEALMKAVRGELPPGADWPDTKRHDLDIEIGDQWDVDTDPTSAVIVGEGS